MVEYRELDENERKFTEKNFSANEAESNHLKLMVKYNEFMLEEMLFSNYLEKRRAFEKQTMDYKAEIVELEAVNVIAKEQLDNGVEVVELVEDLGEVSMVD